MTPCPQAVGKWAILPWVYWSRPDCRRITSVLPPTSLHLGTSRGCLLGTHALLNNLMMLGRVTVFLKVHCLQSQGGSMAAGVHGPLPPPHRKLCQPNCPAEPLPEHRLQTPLDSGQTVQAGPWCSLSMKWGRHRGTTLQGDMGSPVGGAQTLALPALFCLPAK